MSSVRQPLLFKQMDIAPCGINCGTCIAHLRDKNQCPGCRSTATGKPHHCERCSIKFCAELRKSGEQYCFLCEKFPCQRIRQLDKRYRTNYGMSLIGNLRAIRQNGIRKFLHNENIRWKCRECNNALCVHRPDCIVCGTEKNIIKHQDTQ